MAAPCQGIDLTTNKAQTYSNFNPSGGVMYLEKNAQVSVWIQSSEDNSYTVDSQSGFAAVLLRAA